MLINTKMTIDFSSSPLYDKYHKLYKSYFLNLLHKKGELMDKTKNADKNTKNATKRGKYAWTVKVGEKGQFVVPKEARDVFDIHPGDTLLLLADEKKGIAIVRNNDFNKYYEAIFRTRFTDEDEEDNGEKIEDK